MKTTDPEIVELRRKWAIVIDALLFLVTPGAVWLYLMLLPDILDDLREKPHLLGSPFFFVPFLAAVASLVLAVVRVVRGTTWRRRFLWLVLVAVAVGGWPSACSQVNDNDYTQRRLF